MAWKKKFPNLNFFPLILAENPKFFPEFPDQKKSSKFSLISLIDGNPVNIIMSTCPSKCLSH